MNTFTVLCEYDMMLVLLKSMVKMLMEWLRAVLGCLCPHLDGRPWASCALSLYVVNEPRDIESRLLRALLNRSRGCPNTDHSAPRHSSQTHLVLQAIWSGPKKYLTRYPALQMTSSPCKPCWRSQPGSPEQTSKRDSRPLKWFKIRQNNSESRSFLFNSLTQQLDIWGV